MVAKADKKSAADLCVCKHWRNQHDRFGCFDERGTAESCPCGEFRHAVHEQLTRGAKS